MIALLNRFTSLLAEGERLLGNTGSSTPALDAGLLLAHVLGMERMKMIADPPDAVTDAQIEAYRLMLARRAAGEPLFYITGKKEFHNYTFNVDQSVLIPRPETEELVEEVLKRFPGPDPLKVCDVGTGSGCIAITLSLERPAWRVTAADNSPEALETARGNAKMLDAKNVTFILSDLLSGVEGGLDIVVSNPPYVDAEIASTLQVEVRKFEPAAALFASGKGLACIKELARQSAVKLRPGGAFFCEIGFDQKNAVEDIVGTSDWEDVKVMKDISGHDRILYAVRRWIK